MLKEILKIWVGFIPLVLLIIAAKLTIPSSTLTLIMTYSWNILVGILFFIFYLLLLLIVLSSTFRALKSIYIILYKAWAKKKLGR